MIGRERELQQLEELYDSNQFELLTIYGRKGLGKTTLLKEFMASRDVVYFSAQEKNDIRNLADFKRVLEAYFYDEIDDFSDWREAFSYITDNMGKEKLVLIIDEFPFLTTAHPAILNIMQEVIDTQWKTRNLFLILCGSNVSYMINHVEGESGPLSTSVTATMDLLPFDYIEASEFFPSYTDEDKLIAYAILGGVPGYLKAFDPEKDIRTNIAEKLIGTGAILNEEPQRMLHAQLREIAVYNSILEAISNGYYRVTEMAKYIRESKNKCSKYLLPLLDIRVIEKVLPCLDVEPSRKGIYRLTDHLYKFWFHFVFTDRSYFESLDADAAADEIMSDINDYMEPLFEEICLQYFMRAAKDGQLPFHPKDFGKWWGNNPEKKARDSIDVMAVSENGKQALFCECSFRDRPMLMEDYEELVRIADHFTEIENKHFYLIAKGGYSERVVNRAKIDGTALLSIDDLFAV